MPDALIGHTGFVGGNLARQRTFEGFFHSKNIEGIAGQHFDLLVCSGMPAAKWLANQDPEADRASLARLLACLETVRADRVVVISTVDVYPQPVEVDEDTPIDPARQHPYGRHRLLLEEAIQARFADVCIVRLPALFGPGLKKNAIYDLLHDNQVEKIHPESVFQFYNLDGLWRDITTAMNAGLRLVNFATEPISMREVARRAFDRELPVTPTSAPARYDFRTKYAAAFGGRAGYLSDRARVLAELRAFVERERHP